MGKKQIKIDCGKNKKEARKLYEKLQKYIAKIAPKIERANCGYATAQNDVTQKLQNIVDDRDLIKMRDGQFLHHLGNENFDKNCTPTLTVTYSSKFMGKRTKLFEPHSKGFVGLDLILEGMDFVCFACHLICI